MPKEGFRDTVVDQSRAKNVDKNNEPLKVGDIVSITGTLSFLDDATGNVRVNIDSSDGKHYYHADCHAHCCDKE